MVSSNRIASRINQPFRHLMLIIVLLVGFIVYHNQFRFTPLRGENYNVTTAKSRDIDINTETPYLIPDDDTLETLSEPELMEIYWRYINNTQTLCKNQSTIGSVGGTGKEVCLDEDYKPSEPCIVYSIGSNFLCDFDVAAHKYLGCDVYTYDPTKDDEGITISKRIHFSKVGLAGVDFTTDNGWEMKTLQSMFKANKNEQKTIDIVKIDIGGNEWDSLPNIFETGVHRKIKQILIEVHVGHMVGNPNGRFWGNVSVAYQLRALRLMYEGGFRIFKRDPVEAFITEMDAASLPTITPQNEIALINMAFSQN